MLAYCIVQINPLCPKSLTQSSKMWLYERMNSANLNDDDDEPGIARFRLASNRLGLSSSIHRDFLNRHRAIEDYARMHSDVSFDELEAYRQRVKPADPDARALFAQWTIALLNPMGPPISTDCRLVDRTDNRPAPG